MSRISQLLAVRRYLIETNQLALISRIERLINASIDNILIELD